MDKSKMYRVYPTEPVRGYTHTYCLTEDAAWEELLNMEEQTGVEWTIQFPEWAKMKDKALNALMEGIEFGDEDKLKETFDLIDKYWNNEL